MQFDPENESASLRETRRTHLFYNYSVLAMGCGGWPSMLPLVKYERKIGNGGQGRVYQARPVLDCFRDPLTTYYMFTGQIRRV